jgi:metal-sulfur cluster biosynthetic enzyme
LACPLLPPELAHLEDRDEEVRTSKEASEVAITPFERDLVEAALGDVYDPELGLDIVSLGLVYDNYDEDGLLVVDMTLTTPGCPVSESLPQEAGAAVAEAVGPLGRTSEVRVVWDPPWSVERMSDEAAERLGFSRPRPDPVTVRRA